MGIYGMISIGGSQLALILRVYGLWDNRKIAKRLLIGGFVVCYSLTTAFVVLFVVQADRDGITYSAAVNSCVLGNSTYLTGVLGGMVCIPNVMLLCLS